MARIAHVVIVLGRAGQAEGVVPQAGVLHDLHQRLHILVVVFGHQPGARIGLAHEGSRRGDVKATLDALLEHIGPEGL